MGVWDHTRFDLLNDEQVLQRKWVLSSLGILFHHAFANIIFLPAGAHVIEFVGVGKNGAAGNNVPASQMINIANERVCYQGLALACGLHYWAVLPSDGFYFEDTPTQRHHRRQMVVDPAEIVAILERLGVAKSGTVA